MLDTIGGYSIELRDQRHPGNFLVVLYRTDGMWFQSIWKRDFNRGLDWMIEYYFADTLHSQARKWLGVITDDLKERGLLPH